jgi:hypothetical protein
MEDKEREMFALPVQELALPAQQIVFGVRQGN